MQDLVSEAVQCALLEIFWREEYVFENFHRFIRRHRIEIGEPKPPRRKPPVPELLTQIQCALSGRSHGNHAEVRDPVPSRVFALAM